VESHSALPPYSAHPQKPSFISRLGTLQVHDLVAAVYQEAVVGLYRQDRAGADSGVDLEDLDSLGDLVLHGIRYPSSTSDKFAAI
jgi:hypothetical protein